MILHTNSTGCRQNDLPPSYRRCLNRWGNDTPYEGVEDVAIMGDTMGAAKINRWVCARFLHTVI